MLSAKERFGSQGILERTGKNDRRERKVDAFKDIHLVHKEKRTAECNDLHPRTSVASTFPQILNRSPCPPRFKSARNRKDSENMRESLSFPILLALVCSGGYRLCFSLNLLLSSTIMNTQIQDDLEPTVRIRKLQKDRVDFVLGNVDLA